MNNTFIKPDFRNIPLVLRNLNRWVTWKADGQPGEKPRKVPYMSERPNSKASSNDPATWSSFAQAERAYTDGNRAGVGFVLGDGIVGVDIDHCVMNGKPSADAMALLDKLGADYIEISPSGTGLRAFGYGEPLDGGVNGSLNGLKAEFYSTGRYLTLTGKTIKAGSIVQLRGFKETAEAFRIVKKEKVNTDTGEIEPTSPDERQAALVKAILTGEVYHDSLRDLAASMTATGMQAGALVNHLRGLMDASTGPHDDRWKARRAQIPNLVNSAVAKFTPLSDEDFDPKTGEILSSDSAVVEVLLSAKTQDSVALAFTQAKRGQLLYVEKWKQWFIWDGVRWIRDDTSIAIDWVRALSRRYNLDGKTSQASYAFTVGVEKFCRADRAFARTPSQFDQDNYLLNTPGGVVDLRSGAVLPHDPDMMLTKVCAVAPSAGPSPCFNGFMYEICDGDFELWDFLQVALGACLSGAVEAHWLMFWTGTGRNGKNTLGDLVQYILGDYAQKMVANALMDKAHENHPTEIAALQGARMVVSSEISDGAHWNESRILEITGDATLRGRFMHCDEVDFPRTHKHLIYGNHRPQLRNVTEAMRSRLIIVPFKVSFVGRENPMLPAELKDEAPQVLQWMIEGHAMWLKLGRKLPKCEAVDAETADYFDSQATVQMWLSENAEEIKPDIRETSALPTSSHLYSDYSSWKKQRGEAPVSQSRWTDSMKRFKKEKYGTVRYRGLKLKNDFYCLDSNPQVNAELDKDGLLFR